MLKKANVYIFFVLLVVAACKTTPKEKISDVPSQTVVEVNVPNFSADSAYQFVKKQVDFGTRVPGSSGHKACGDWLVTELKRLGGVVTEQPFDANFNNKTVKARNIIAAYNPEATQRIYICAHWDSRYMGEKDPTRPNEAIMGADDGGSGVGVILEIARLLQATPLDKTLGVDFVLFDAEDQGKSDIVEESELVTWCLGSQHWANNPHKAGYRAKYGILLDMVGAKGARFPKEQFSYEKAGPILDRVWKEGQNLGYSGFFDDTRAAAVTDDHYFAMKIAPTIDIINLDMTMNMGDGAYKFGAHHHTHQDNMDIIDKATLQAVGHTVTSIIYKEVVQPI